MTRPRTRTLALSLAALLAGSCGHDSKKEGDEGTSIPLPSTSSSAIGPAPLSTSSGAPPASATASAERPRGSGPMVKITAGSLTAGQACSSAPRVTDEELPGASVSLGEFAMDVYPYPNDPTQPLKTNVTRAQAEELCRAAGKRLCSELEWERACKGTANTTFEYGMSYDKRACEKTTTAGARDKCQSAFGVRDMHGLAFEWTSSPWTRGKSDLATVRGYGGAANVVRERCASGEGRDPGRGYDDVAFRCCSGPENPQTVDLTITHAPTLVEERPRPDLIANLMKVMPPDHQKVEGGTVAFDRIWKWHPRDNEELLLARWVARMNKGGPRAFEIAVFKSCGGAPPVRIERMRGPVEKLDTLHENPAAKDKLSIDVATKKDKGTVELTYWYGAVGLKEPAWVKPGNSLSHDKEKPKKPPPAKAPIKKRK